MAKGFFNNEFWKSFDKLGIYSKEDGELLADQEDAPLAGGANSSDEEKSDDSNEQNNDMNLNLNPDASSGGMDLGDDSLSTSDSGEENQTDENTDTSGNSTQTDVNDNPIKNPFKDSNSKSLLDTKLAELQSAVSDTLQKIYAYPKVDTVVVSELENLLDSIRNIRETVYMVPVENTVYRYKLAVMTYTSIGEMLIKDLQVQNK